MVWPTTAPPTASQTPADTDRPGWRPAENPTTPVRLPRHAGLEPLTDPALDADRK